MASETLADYAKKHKKRQRTAWAETALPEEIQQQIIDTPEVGSRVIVHWLQELGFDEATESKVEYLRRLHR